MPTGAITSYVDVAQLVLYAFWIFFAGLIFYLRREDKREGYPLEREGADRRAAIQGFTFPPLPTPKTFHLAEGVTYTAPPGRQEAREIRATPVALWPGAPLQPTGDPMVDGLGAAAYAERENAPDLTADGLPKIVPMRVATDFFVEPRDPDPRGTEVIAADGGVAGIVSDLWVDRAEALIRYLEVDVAAVSGARRVLVPMSLARVRPARLAGVEGPITERVKSGRRQEVIVKSILAAQFAEVPGLENADQVTKREEDRIAAYYAGGHRYAVPSRQEPLL